VLLWDSDRAETVLPYLEWAISSAAVDATRDRYVLFHAGAVAHQGQGVLLPAGSGSGKSTLVAALAASGFQALGDDIVALDPGAVRLELFAKSTCVKGGSRGVLAPFFPAVRADPPTYRSDREPVWYLPTAGTATGPVPVRHVVLPRYVPDG
jgi:hypothetical protein